ncbi:C-type mannose receptor 2-like [Mercenaria mercenaria]|uniref:C-type mannose receptor 2-like n=1 Tax=Mercenaria mercenaria TaxID=6596 RepID=UPI00234F9A1E|nr:C-type mannose receptor 2-like [Mercenaria mercenaria]
MQENSSGIPHTTISNKLHNSTSVLLALTTSVPPSTTAESIVSTVGRSETTDTIMLSSTADYKESTNDNKTTTSEAVDVTISRPYTSIVSTDIISSITEATKRPASPTSTSVVLTSTVYSGSDKTNFITTVKTMQENSTGIPYITTSNELHNSTSVLQGHIELCPKRIQHLSKQPGELIAQLGKNCYEIVQAAVSWSHAESNCKSNGGHLIHIANQQEQDFINNFLVKHHSHEVWLGLHDRNQEENFEWTSGNTITYTNWKPGRKDYRYHNSEDCVYMSPSTGQWDDVQCGGDTSLSELFHIRHAYICQYATVDAATSDGNINMCSYNLHQQAERDRGVLGQYDHSCYEIVPNAKVAWQHAEDICHSRGGHLVYISSLQEQAFIQRFLNRYSPSHAVWIGLSDHNSEGHFQWTSGAPVHFTNWVPHHMSNYVSSSQEDCVAFMPYKNGQWDDIPCGSTHHSIFGGTSSSGEIHPLLCQYRIPSVSEPSLIG